MHDQPHPTLREELAPHGAAAGQGRPAVDAPVTTVVAIVVTWNRWRTADAVLRALAGQEYPLDRLHVVVVDNGSDDGTTAELSRAWRPERVVENPAPAAHQPDFTPGSPPIRGGSAPVPPPAESEGAAPQGNTGGFATLTIVHNHSNLGGCGGFNTGFGFVERFFHGGADALGAPPDYLWLVDDDIDLPTGALRQLVRTADADPAVGIVGSRAVDFDDRKTTFETTIYFDFARGRMSDTPLPSHRLAASHARWAAGVGGTKGDRPFTGVREVDVASACSLLARWSAVRQVGYWDYRYFIYCDDADWCLRMGKAGYRVVCDLDAVVYHTPWFHKLTPARLYYSQRNIVWVLQKIFRTPRLQYATFRWLASIMLDGLAASQHRRLFHAEIIRRTAADIMANRGGRLEDEGPPDVPLLGALEAAGALRPGARVALLCRTQEALAFAQRLRCSVAEQLAAEGRAGDGPRWIEIVRNDVPGAERAAPGAERIVYSPRLRSKLRRQLPLFRRPPAAAIVIDQTNDFPLLRARHNIHVDRKWPGRARLERDGLAARLRFLARWAATGVRVLPYILLLRPYRSPHRYG